MLRNLAAGLFILAANFATAHAQTPPQFALPIDCEIGPTCFIQKYVDLRKGKDYADYRCGSLSNDKHTGTDFRLVNHSVMADGVAVLAAADGIVRNIRDGMPDVDVRLVGRATVLDRGLGNTVIVDHGGGWRTFYGHMRRGSVAVSVGQKVVSGQKIGLIGLSGLTEFPHVHFEVRYGKRPVDPFVGLATHTGCTLGKKHLWKPDVLARLTYRPTFLLGAGFSDRPLVRAALQYGLYERTVLSRKLGNLNFGVFVAGLRNGDRYTLELADANGKTLRSNNGTINRHRAVQFLKIGLKHNRPLPAGHYRGRYSLHGVRDGKPETLIEIERKLELR